MSRKYKFHEKEGAYFNRQCGHEQDARANVRDISFKKLKEIFSQNSEEVSFVLIDFLA